jgi:hypothetical protein
VRPDDEAGLRLARGLVGFFDFIDGSRFASAAASRGGSAPIRGQDDEYHNESGSEAENK